MAVGREDLAAFVRRLAPFVVLAVALTTLGVLLVDDDARALDRIRLFATATYGMFSVVASVLLYLAWRMAGRAAYGWMSSMLLSTGLQSFPFILTAFADPLGGGSNAQVVELPVALWMMLLVVLARRGTSRGLHPLALGVGAAVVLALARIGLAHASWVPESIHSGTQPLQRLALVVVTGVIVVGIARTPYDARFKLTFLVGAAITGAASAASTELPGVDPSTDQGTTLVTASLIGVLAVLVLDCSIRALDQSFAQQQTQLEELAGLALRAEATLNRDEELLHEIRSTVGGLATASSLLSEREDLSEAQRTSLTRAVLHELHRVDRTVSGAVGDLCAFDLAGIVEPLVAFHRTSGQDITWQPAGLTGIEVLHVPDSVTQVVGTLLHNAHRHAHQRPVLVTGRREGDLVHLTVSHPGPSLDASVQARLFERGARSTSSPGQGLGLSVARRLMVDHGGDLRLLHSSEELTAFQMTCPVAPARAAAPADGTAQHA